MMTKTILHTQALATQAPLHPLGKLVCRQLCRGQATTIKEAIHGSTLVEFNNNGAACLRKKNPLNEGLLSGDNLFYSVVLYHVDKRALTSEEWTYAQTAIEEILTHHGIEHSIACIDSDYDKGVERHRGISRGEQGHPDTDSQHLAYLSDRYGKKGGKGIGHISFRIPNTEENTAKLLEVMSKMNEIAPKRSHPARVSS